MIILTKFSIGDSVWIVCKHRGKKFVTCPICKGTGEILIQGKDYTCPECYGNKGYDEYTKLDQHFVDYSGVVGEITVRIHNHEKDNKIQYMIDSTGIGSGSLWDEKQVFGSQEEALAYCNMKNLGDELS